MYSTCKMLWQDLDLTELLKARMQWNEKRLEADRAEENEGAQQSGKEVSLRTEGFQEN